MLRSVYAINARLHTGIDRYALMIGCSKHASQAKRDLLLIILQHLCLYARVSNIAAKDVPHRRNPLILQPHGV